MLPRCDLIVRDARVIAHAEDYSPDYGIQDDFLLVQLNTAIHKLQKELVATEKEPNASFLVVEASGYDYVSTPADCFIDNLIYDVEYSADGADYYTLNVGFTRSSGNRGAPTSYNVVGPYIYFDSIVDSGYLRIRYEKAFRGVDFRRAGVAGYSPGTVGEVLTSLTAWVNNVHGNDPVYPDADAKALGAPPDFISIVNHDGVFGCKDIRIAAYDTASGEFDLRWNTARLLSSLDIDNRDAFIVIGRNTSSHPEGPPIFYDYFVEYLRWEIEKARSKLSAAEESTKVRDILASIIEIYDRLPSGRLLVPTGV